MITMIPRSRLEPHPDNPRKDLGDLSELSASIAKQGLLQNLTVVPSPDTPDKYRIVIGHRRFAASEKAGLTELPCSIDEKMTYPEQIAVMMSENIQRNDLTVTERVGGVQMMLDLGMDIAEIAGNTGISDTTVRRYAKLAKLNRGNMNAAESRGATLLQFAEIAEIEDETLRDEALTAVGTNNYQHLMWEARNLRDRKQRLPLMLEKLNEFAEEVEKNEWDRHSYVDTYRFTDESVLTKISRPKANAKYVYVVNDCSVTLYEERPPVDDAKEQPKRAARERMQLRANHERDIASSFRNMRDFYMATLSLKGCEEAAKRFVLWAMTRTQYLPSATKDGLFAKRFLAGHEDDSGSYTSGIVMSADEIGEVPEKSLLLGMVLVAYDRICSGDMAMLDRYSGKPKDDSEADKIRNLYRHMEAFGYSISTAEHEWLDGTHECYTYTGETQKEDGQPGCAKD